MTESTLNRKGDSTGWLLRDLFAGEPRPSQPAESDSPCARQAEVDARPEGRFFPREPTSEKDLGIRDGDVVGLLLGSLHHRNVQPGRQLADELRLPLRIVEPYLRGMREEKLISVRSSSGSVDYEYELTERGADRARISEHNATHRGAAPVPFEQYVESLEQQSPGRSPMTPDQLRRALVGFRFDDRTLNRVGQAMVGGRAILVSGAPGNGKTSIASRLSEAYSEGVWIPRAVNFNGVAVRLFDPLVHRELPVAEDATTPHDQRWIFVRRPTVVVGGELTLDSFEFRVEPRSGLLEAPVHLKANCGTLVVDDFGRQRVSTTELLNRLIVPLESRFDMLTLPGGQSLRVPFEQLTVFSTNLDPADLVDEAFMRRIPYKIRVPDPTTTQFRELFGRTCGDMQLECDDSVLEHLLARHYEAEGRAMRFCHVRDLLSLVQNDCTFNGLPSVVTTELVDEAAENYFAT